MFTDTGDKSHVAHTGSKRNTEVGSKLNTEPYRQISGDGEASVKTFCLRPSLPFFSAISVHRTLG